MNILDFSPSSEDHVRVRVHVRKSSWSIRMVMRVSKSRWFSFLRRVFHYQNGSRSDLGSNPFNSSTLMLMELILLLVQISITSLTLAVSESEQPVWPIRIWIVCYDTGCILSLLLLYSRYKQVYVPQADGFNRSDLEQQSNNEGPRNSHLMNRCTTLLELFFAIWFVMGNIWVSNSQLQSLDQAPRLRLLCISLLVFNTISYSFPFLLFLLLCCCVPLISKFLGYNMNMGYLHRGASEDQISALPSWRYTKVDTHINEEECCCICLAKYRHHEEVKKLPCSHIFHLKCVDQWLNIISCCPLCKQELET